jgi:Raf kinase inhibitor-like YbhB/YbcL family protein
MIADIFFRAAMLLTTVRLADGVSDGQFRLTSPDFSPGATLNDEQAFNGMGCTGQNVSPALRWSGAPAGTKSFALLLHDPDAPTGGAGWWHWIAYDIPAGTSELPKGAGKPDGSAMPSGAKSVPNDYATPGYGGPCPPEGDKPHRYIFTLYALKVAKLELPQGAHAPVVGFVVNANALGKASVTGMYGRAKR